MMRTSVRQPDQPIRLRACSLPLPELVTVPILKAMSNSVAGTLDLSTLCSTLLRVEPPESEGRDALFGDQFVHGDIESLSKLLEEQLPLRRPVVLIAAAEEIVPDVLRLPEVDVVGQASQGRGDGERRLHSPFHGSVGLSGGLQLHHGPLHPLAGGEAEVWRVELYLISGGAAQQRLYLIGIKGVRLNSATQTGVDGEVGRQGQGGRRGHAGLGQETQQRDVILVD